MKVIVFIVGLLLCFGLSQLAQAAEIAVLLDENVDEIIKQITNGAATASKVTGNDAFTEFGGKESLKITVTGGGEGTQKFNPNIPGWIFKVREKPGGKDEFRYISWAWRKVKGAGIQLQLSGQGDWGHRYHAGNNVLNWNPSNQIRKDIPGKWEFETADLFTDWREFTLTGMAFTSQDGEASFWDKVVLHQTKENPLSKKEAVEPNGKLATSWGRLKSHLP